MGEFDTLLGVAIPTVIGLVTIVSYHLWNRRNRSDKIKENKQLSIADVEKTARDKIKEEQATARELSGQAKALALDVKQDMKEHIDRLISVLKQDIELSRTQIYAKIDVIDLRLAQLKIDLMEHILNEKDEDVRMQKQIEFIKQLKGGQGGKGGEGGEGGESAEGVRGHKGQEGKEGEKGEES
jgi:hypothetical protein